MSHNTWYNSGRRRRAIPVPLEIRIPEPNAPFVAPIRNPPGTPWTPAYTSLPQVFPQPTFPPPQPQPAWVNPTPSYYSHPLPGNTPVWPTPLPLSSLYPPAFTPAFPTYWEPGTFPAEPFGTPVPLRLHPHLIYNPVNPLIPTLQWDIIHRAEQARVFTGRQVIVPVDLAARAIMPDVPKIYITSDHHVLQSWMEIWGPIMVEKSGITIRDILDAIYEYFQKPLTRREFRRISESPHNLANLTYAAHQRAGDSYELFSVGLASGFRRADAVGGHRRFQGLRPVVFQDNTWKLFLGLLPGPVPHVA